MLLNRAVVDGDNRALAMSIISIVAESVHTTPHFPKPLAIVCRYEIHAMFVDVAGKFF